MKKHLACAVTLAGLLAGPLCTVRAADEALLQVLLNNNLITQGQYEAIKKAEAGAAQSAAAKGTARRVPTPDEGLLDVLLTNGLITQEQYAALQVKNAADQGRKQETKEARVTLADGLKFKSPDGDFSAQVGMYAQLDSAWYGDEARDYSDATELRRARLSLSGTVLGDWDYKLEADFAGTTLASGNSPGTSNNVVVTDAYLRYTGLRPVAITAGNFKVPFSLEAVSSAKYNTFMERGLPSAFLNLRSLGAMVSSNGLNWTGAVGVFGDTATQQNNDDEGGGVAGRFTYAPIFKSDRVLHLGVSGQWRLPDANSAAGLESIRFRSKPESNIITDDFSGTGSGGRLVDTGAIGGDVDDYTLVGVEAAGVYGPLSVQGEYLVTEVDRNLLADATFDGFYVYGSYFLSRDLRNYKADRGVFDAVAPARPFSLKNGGWGAWEIALRYSGLDLNDAGVTGGALRDVTAGLNWYPNSFVRLTANYVHVLDVDGGVHDGEDLDLFQVRAQMVY